ncbi:MAG: hypothetical protein U0893_20910 [Chloroflexota bacterium]
MDHLAFTRFGRALLLSITLVTATTFLSTAVLHVPGTGPTIAEASVAQEKDKDRPKGKNEGNDDDADHRTSGQVLEINTLKDPPELVLASVDGLTTVRVLKTDEIAINGVRLGDYIEVIGEKIDETLWEATELSVSEHYKGDDGDKKKKK